ncbi:alpha/beta family hydrolase [Actinomycetospora sp. TBRC 11914]|uniref:alpha/beta hydrolase family protein n=1 Tax=Actinomycetospora sp. TBRC 11914 TaxID=2729387 RepID=UPI00145DFE06|nr:alpha/beta family hydrolase [Actinomycetospora sp. TBRC 11914]NMO90751.1 alpha/beta hydrolase [Actinomycetospora sp. TBRC 11914]
MSELEIPTPHGPARVTLEAPEGAAGLLVLGHGAGGGIEAPDLRAAAAAAGPTVAVARVLQPYRVAGRRGPAPAAQLDEAWAAVLADLTRRFPGVPQVHGGRSSGARVACRGAVVADPAPVGVLALAFPLLAPPRKDGTRGDRTPEIDGVDAAGIPVLAVSGDRDRFGVPSPAAHREVVTVRGDHSLRAQGPIRDAVAPWLEKLLAG